MRRSTRCILETLFPSRCAESVLKPHLKIPWTPLFTIIYFHRSREAAHPRCTRSRRDQWQGMIGVTFVFKCTAPTPVSYWGLASVTGRRGWNGDRSQCSTQREGLLACEVLFSYSFSSFSCCASLPSTLSPCDPLWICDCVIIRDC